MTDTYLGTRESLIGVLGDLNPDMHSLDYRHQGAHEYSTQEA